MLMKYMAMVLLIVKYIIQPAECFLATNNQLYPNIIWIDL